MLLTSSFLQNLPTYVTGQLVSAHIYPSAHQTYLMTAIQSITAQSRQTSVVVGKNLAKNQCIGLVHGNKNK